MPALRVSSSARAVIMLLSNITPNTPASPPASATATPSGNASLMSPPPMPEPTFGAALLSAVPTGTAIAVRTYSPGHSRPHHPVGKKKHRATVTAPAGSVNALGNRCWRRSTMTSATDHASASSAATASAAGCACAARCMYVAFPPNMMIHPQISVWGLSLPAILACHTGWGHPADMTEQCLTHLFARCVNTGELLELGIRLAG